MLLKDYLVRMYSVGNSFPLIKVASWDRKKVGYVFSFKPKLHVFAMGDQDVMFAINSRFTMNPIPYF